MKLQDTSVLLKKINSELWLTLRMTFIFGAFFFIVNQDYTLKTFFITIGISAMYSFGLGFGQGILNEYLTSKWDWVTQTNKRVWIGIIATVAYTVPAILIIHYVLFIKIQGRNFDAFFNERMIYMHLFWMLFSFAISAFLHARGFMIEWKKSVSQESTQQQIVAKTESAKFETLKSQIDPHFLFNSLNVLTSLISENPLQAERFTTKLSKVYRYVLEQRNKELIPIEEELKFARTYMELLQMRFEDALEFQVPETVSNSELKIVPLSLQLLLENAVKHNVVSSKTPLKISIFEDENYLKVQNNANPKEALGKGTKVGLQNIADRYGLISKEHVKIDHNSQTFTVSLPLLKKSITTMKTSDNKFENSSYVRAVEKVQKIKEFYQNVISYVIFIPLMIFINLRFSPQFQWFWFPMAGWGIGLLFHGLDAFGFNFLLGKDWEERKIKELMDNNKRY